MNDLAANARDIKFLFMLEVGLNTKTLKMNMQKTIRELVNQIESVISKYANILPEHLIMTSQDEIRELCAEFLFPDPKGLDELYPCVHYLLYYYSILPVEQICEYRSILKDDGYLELTRCATKN